MPSCGRLLRRRELLQGNKMSGSPYQAGKRTAERIRADYIISKNQIIFLHQRKSRPGSFRLPGLLFFAGFIQLASIFNPSAALCCFLMPLPLPCASWRFQMHPGWIPASFPGIWLNWHFGCLGVYAVLYKGMYLVNGSAYRTMSARYILEDSLVLIRDSVRMTRYVQSALWPHHGQCSHIQRFNGIIWKKHL